jgi:hypothetical protein
MFQRFKLHKFLKLLEDSLNKVPENHEELLMHMIFELINAVLAYIKFFKVSSFILNQFIVIVAQGYSKKSLGLV